MTRWYDKQGQEIDMMTAARMPSDYYRVARTLVGDYEVSTIWLGLDHNHGPSGPPVIFETMVFAAGTSVDEYCERYHTLEEAKAGHDNIVGMVGALSELST